MIRPKASVTQEDHFILHLAGETVLPALEGHEEKPLRGPADVEAPRSSCFDTPLYARLNGFIWGGAASLTGGVAYVISNSLGTCGENIPVFQTALQKARLLFPSKWGDFIQVKVLRHSNPWNVEEWLIPEKKTSWIFWTTYDENKCHTVNFIANAYRHLTNSPILIPAIAIGVIAGFIFWKGKAIENSVHQREQNLKHQLTDTFGQIATRLRSRSNDPKIDALCRKILARQTEINKEIKSIGIAWLKWQDIEDITHPVFDTCIQLTTRPPTTIKEPKSTK